MFGSDTKNALAHELAAANALFHDAYDEAREAAAREPTVFVVLADDLVVVRGAARETLRFTPEAFHALKAAVHVAVGLYTALHDAGGALLERARRRRVEALGDHARKALAAPSPLPPGESTHFEAVLHASLSLAESTAAEQRVSAARLDQFAREVRAPILGLTDQATALQLDGLHARVEEAFARLPADAKSALEVVVAGDHQARRRNFGMQYFQRRLGEAEGEEGRLFYGENVETLDKALTLVGTMRLDRSLARGFFGDQKRLQRDILGDSAKKRLDAMALRPLTG